MWRDRLQDRLRPLLAPLWAAGQSWRACRRGDKIRWCQWIESDPSRRFVIPSASAGPADLAQAPLVVRLYVRSESRRVGASRCRKRSEEHTSELQSLRHLVCRLLLEKKNMR